MNKKNQSFITKYYACFLFYILAARIVRVPVCLWFWIDVRITNWAGQEDFFFFFFSAALDGRRGNDKTGQKRSSRHRTSPYREKTIVILRLPGIWQRHKDGGIRTSGVRCPWRIQSRRHKRPGYSGVEAELNTSRGQGRVRPLRHFSPGVGSSTSNYNNNFSRRIAVIQIHQNRTDQDKRKILNYLLGWPTSWEIFKPKYLGIATRILED